MPVGDVIELTVMGSLHGQSIQNVLHYYTSAVGIGDVQVAAATILGANVGNEFKAALSNEYTYLGVNAAKIFPLPRTYTATDTTGSGTGSVVQNSLPTTVAATLTKETSLAGRRYRGRVFVAGLPVTYETDSNVNATGLTGLGTLATALETSFSDSGFTFDPILWHRGDQTLQPLRNVRVRVPLRVQRRREVGVGI